MPAIITPINIAGKDCLKGMSNKKAQALPVQAPVAGNGIATNSIKAKAFDFSNFWLCFFLVLSKNQLIIFLNVVLLEDKKLDTFSK